MVFTNLLKPLISLRPVLDWLPGESLFSLCSRYHRISGNRIPAHTCNALFGTHRTGSSHDVPARVQTLVDRADGALGEAREILIGRTPLPFYFAFHPSSLCDEWLAQMSTGTSPALKARLGLAASQFGASHPLKACPSCMQSDALVHGVAYWHSDHQVPGVFVCPSHKIPLLISTDKVSGQDRHGWVLPGQSRLTMLLKNHRPMGGELLLAEGALALWRLPTSFAFSQERLASLYKVKFVEQEFIHAASSRVDHKRFERCISTVLENSSISTVWPWLTSMDNVRILSRRILRMIHPTSPRFSRHPLNHLPLILLLFGSWESFWSDYQKRDLGKTVETHLNVQSTSLLGLGKSDANDSLQKILIEMVRSGYSISRAAQLAGVAVATAMSWAASEGMHIPRRPKVLKPDVRSHLIRKLKRGVDKTVAASLAGVSVETVTRVLMTEPGLHAHWKRALFTKAQKRSRDSWQAIREAFPEASSNDWRKLDPAAYAWLYRNDRSWLQSSIQTRTLPPCIQIQRRDWQKRDALLAQAVRVEALKWHMKHSGTRPTIGILCAAVDGLRQKMSALSKLPLTRKAIREACSNSRTGASSSQEFF